MYDVAPGAPALDVLRGLLATSVTRLESDGLVSGAREIGYAPYKVLIVSSLVEKEGITADMPKVARVLYNRLGAGQRLQLDSTVNYPLDLQALRTNADDRAKPGPYNSYAVAGLPPTPIARPGRTRSRRRWRRRRGRGSTSCAASPTARRASRRPSTSTTATSRRPCKNGAF